MVCFLFHLVLVGDRETKCSFILCSQIFLSKNVFGLSFLEEGLLIRTRCFQNILSEVTLSKQLSSQEFEHTKGLLRKILVFLYLRGFLLAILD